MPARATTEAATPVWPSVTLAGAVMAGTIGAASTFTVAVPGPLVVLPLLSRQVTVRAPAAPAVKVRLLVPPLVTPAVPPALVMVPPEMVQT